jgi:hypothetical protein
MPSKVGNIALSIVGLNGKPSLTHVPWYFAKKKKENDF